MAVITGPNQQKGMSQGEKIPEGYEKFKLQNFTPEQMEMLQQMISQLGPDSWLAKLAGGDEGEFEAIEAPQKRQFGEALGGVASKFSGMGMGGQKSSGFQNTMTSAASNFAQELGAQRHGLKSNALQELMQMSQGLMAQKPYETGLSEKPMSGVEQFLLSLGGGIGTAAGAYAGKKFGV